MRYHEDELCLFFLLTLSCPMGRYMEALSTVLTYSSWAIKAVRMAQKLIDLYGNGKLSGIWCSCWQNRQGSSWHQIGTIRMKQSSKKTFGEFYSGNQMWPFEGEFSNGQVLGVYDIGDDLKKQFKLAYVRNNTSHLAGEWSGLTSGKRSKSQVPNEPVERWGLNIYAVRGDSICPDSHLKKFAEDEGFCLTVQ
jgi:hypothetical protein